MGSLGEKNQSHFFLMHIDPDSKIAKDARILIVDDEQQNVARLGEILSRAGYGICISITDPRQAAAKFQEIQPDLLLLDWHMGETCGMDVLREIRKNVPETWMPPVVVLTADDSQATKREALEAGVSDFLSKPIDYSEVLLRIRNLLLLRAFHLRDLAVKHGLEEQVREKTAELEKALAELRESHDLMVQQERIRALGAMSGGIAHDFNNTLTIILGYCEMFSDREDIAKNPGGALEAFVSIGRAAADSAEVVRRLREFHRPYHPGEDDRRMVDLRELMEEAVQLSVPRWRTQTQARGIFIDVVKELAEVPLVPASAPELREVMMNLIFNAVDAMPRGGRIVARTGMEGELAFFEIEDSGEGMSEETRRHCMEPFYTTKGKSGTGLGLATTYGIVRRHQGYIGIDSDVGQGTRFTVLLPVKRMEEGQTRAEEGGPGAEGESHAAAAEAKGAEHKELEADHAAAPGISKKDSGPQTHATTTTTTESGAKSHAVSAREKAGSKGHGVTWARAPLEPEPRPARGERVPPHALRVLVVDDQPDICHVLRHYLERDAHKVETAANGREALEKFSGGEFDVVITDRAMPKMNGVQLASAIKGLHPGEPVILLTAYAEEPEKMSPDVDVQLDKPASLHKIRQAIRRVMAA